MEVFLRREINSLALHHTRLHNQDTVNHIPTPSFFIILRSMQEEIIRPERRCTREIIIRRTFSTESNVLRARFVLTIINADTPFPTYKARFVAYGHKDTDKDLIVHNYNTINPVSIPILRQFSCQMGWFIWTNDINQAFIQITGYLTRNVYSQPPKRPHTATGLHIAPLETILPPFRCW